MKIIFCFFIFLSFPIFSEGANNPLPEGFREIKLGMGINDVKEKLKADPLFNYRGDPDVSMLSSPNNTLIECSGFSYIKNAYFQFHEEKLYIIILVLNSMKIDHYSVYTKLMEKYGNPDSLSPEEILWSSDIVRMSLERPLSMKYIKKDVFEKLKTEGRAEKSMRILSRERFLELF